MDKAKWKMVPTVATPEMIDAFFSQDFTQNGYEEMLAAAPRPPSASGEREAFEATMPKLLENRIGTIARSMQYFDDETKEYDSDFAECAWLAWQARAALAPSPGIDAAEQKPVAWMADDGRVANAESRAGMHAITQASYCIPLYAAPPAAQPSAEWLAEAERLVEAYAKEFAQGGATYARDIHRTTLRAHLRSPHAPT